MAKYCSGLFFFDGCSSTEIFIFHVCRLILSYKKQVVNMKKPTAGMSMRGSEFMMPSTRCFPVEKKEILMQLCKKCLTKQQLR